MITSPSAPHNITVMRAIRLLDNKLSPLVYEHIHNRPSVRALVDLIMHGCIDNHEHTHRLRLTCAWDSNPDITISIYYALSDLRSQNCSLSSEIKTHLPHCTSEHSHLTKKNSESFPSFFVHGTCWRRSESLGT